MPKQPRRRPAAILERRLDVSFSRLCIGRDVLDQLVHHEKGAAFDGPQLVVGEFMAQQGTELQLVECLEDGSLQHDVKLPRDEKEPGVHDAFVLRLINGERRSSPGVRRPPPQHDRGPRVRYSAAGSCS